MGLREYKKKRSFNKTPEPEGGKGANKELVFVVQQHAASRLHYDFRLEMDGVLKSWAIPKGPSVNPADKRLAMMVEDHPFDYRNFEGIIPKGNYGAGTVIVWDKGTYEPLESTGDKRKDEKLLLRQLKAGSLKFSLKGKKLKGEFAIFRLKTGEDNAWLMVKHRDQYAAEAAITEKNKSVVSKKTLEQVAKTSNKIWGRKTINSRSTLTDKQTTAAKGKQASANTTATKKTAVKKKASKKATTESSANKTGVSNAKALARTKKKPAKAAAGKRKAVSALKDAPKAPFPKVVSPMLATLVKAPIDESGWLYEIKWDGYRVIALCNKKQVTLLSRNNKSFNEKFYPVFTAVRNWGIRAVVDGEIVVLNDQGISHFGSLQNWRSEADGEIVFYAFDLLWLDGRDLTELPLVQRRALLRPLVPEEGLIRISENFETSASEFMDVAGRMGMEGFLAKKADSIYRPGERTKDWLKIKINQRHEVVIGGYTNNEGSSKTFSSLLVGVHENGKLKYTGKIGTGFNDKKQREMMEQFRPLIVKKNPFSILPDVNKPSRFRPNPPKAQATWLKPKLVCEVSYTEITQDGVMRHPSFEGMREDKNAKEVVAENADAITAALTDKEKSPAAKLLKTTGPAIRKTLLNPKEESQVRKINGHELKFSNLGKIYWPREKFTKRDMLNYYYQMAPYILPYLIDRPQSLNRYPNGINGKSFYQKDVTGKSPSWIKQFPYHTGEGEDKNFMVPTDEASLLWMANLGAIEMNPWNSTIHKPDNPDWCCLDLDPDKSNTFEQVIETARMVKQALDEFKIEGYPKTSGSTGIHVYIPLGAKYTYDECQLFGKLIATRVQQELPGFTSIERMTKNRKGKLYIDYLQNRSKATLAAPYSLRPKPGATVSMPLYWEEVKKGLSLKDFTITNAVARVKKEGDLFKPVLGKGIDLNKVISDWQKST